MTFDPNKHLSAARKGGPANYLAVQWRLVWLRDEHPEATITTEAIRVDDQFAFFRAIVTYPYTTVRSDGELVTLYASATGHGSETVNDFRDYIEKAETKALGRALAAIGYGTQFAAVDFDEGGTVADAPVQRQQQAPAPRQDAPAAPQRTATADDMHRITTALKGTLTAGAYNLLRREIDALGIADDPTISILVTEVEERRAAVKGQQQALQTA